MRFFSCSCDFYHKSSSALFVIFSMLFATSYFIDHFITSKELFSLYSRYMHFAALKAEERIEKDFLNFFFKRA